MKQERLTKLLENAEIKLVRAHKSLNRLNKELQQKQAENYITTYTESDIKRKQREIADIEKSITEYREKLKVVQSIEEIPVLREFIKNWKEKATKYYIEQYNKLMEYKSWLEQQEKIYEKWKEQEHKSYLSKESKEKRKELKIDEETKTTYLKNHFDAVIINIGMYDNRWKQQIKKIVDNEAERKYINFLNRIKKAVGKTLDCSGLYIADNLEINGFVSGELGKAEIRTITAGGYNIQCWHYRVLVNLIKEV